MASADFGHGEIDVWRLALLPFLLSLFLGDCVNLKQKTYSVIPQVVWLDHRGKLLTFEDRRIISDERISLERPYIKEWNLHVRNVRPSDEGRYMCQVNSDPVQVNPVNLKVHEPPQIIDELSSSLTVVVQEGETVELVCNVTGVPPPTVTWFRIPTGLMQQDDRALDPADGKKHIGEQGEVLVIHNVTRYCDDVYQCVAHNDVPDTAHRSIRVYVEFPPEVRLPNRKIGQSKGKTTILECVVTAYPHAITVWKRHGEVIERNSKYNLEVYDEDENTLTLALRIQSLTDADYGQYKCVSENKLGKDSETMILYEYPVATTTTTTTLPPPPRKKTTKSHHGLATVASNNRAGDRKDDDQWDNSNPGPEPDSRLDNYDRYTDKQRGGDHGRHPDHGYLEKKNPWKGPVIVEPRSKGANHSSASVTRIVLLMWIFSLVTLS